MKWPISNQVGSKEGSNDIVSFLVRPNCIAWFAAKTIPYDLQ